jgi:hypothetical protein
MSLPFSKITLDAITIANIPDNNAQLITAEKLRETLDPIVNSTFGLKTIWSGWVNAQTTYSGTALSQYNNSAIFISEDYYDPNYFPALDPNNLTSSIPSYQAAGCRYKLVNQGSNLTGSDGTYSTTIYNNTFNTSAVGVGLTFDVKIVSNSVVAIKVNNPGTGYCWGRYGSGLSGIASLYTPTIVEIMIGWSGGGNNPRVEIDLSRVINMDMRQGGTTTGGVIHKYLNFFIPDAGNTIGYGSGISLQATGKTATNTIYDDVVAIPIVLGEQNTGRIKTGVCDFNSTFTMQYPLANSVDTTTKGYYTTFLTGSNQVNSPNNAFKLEVKVPIINTNI